MLWNFFESILRTYTMEKTIAIILIIGVCVQCVLSQDDSNTSKPRRRSRRRIQPAKPYPNEFDPDTDRYMAHNPWIPYGMPPYGMPMPSPRRASSFHRNKSSWPVPMKRPEPQLPTGEPVTLIKGENGVIERDGKVIQSNDEVFKNGVVKVKIVQGNISINDKVIYEGKPANPEGFTSMSINSEGIKSFKIQIFKDGKLLFTDDRGAITRGNL